LINQNSSDYYWLKSVLKPEQCILYRTNNKIPFWLTLKKLLSDNKIDVLLSHNRKTPEIERVLRQIGIKIINSDYLQQAKYEDRASFDSFLEQNNLPHPRSTFTTLAHFKPYSYPLVIQKNHSSAGEGTYFIQNAAQLKKLITTKILNTQEKYLIRKFVKGRSLGITIYVDPKLIALSAVREQIFYDLSPWQQKHFQGLQWLSTKSFSTKLITIINKTFGQIAQTLYRDKYLGYANIDFIVTPEDKVAILECNSGPTEAMIHLAAFPELTGNHDLGPRFIQAAINRQSYSNNSQYIGYPGSEFQGALLHLLIPPKAKPLPFANKPAGVYLLNGKPKFCSPNLEEITGPGKRFIYYNRYQMAKHQQHYSYYGTIYSNFPLFTSLGKLNTTATTLSKFFQND